MAADLERGVGAGAQRLARSRRPPARSRRRSSPTPGANSIELSARIALDAARRSRRRRRRRAAGAAASGRRLRLGRARREGDAAVLRPPFLGGVVGDRLGLAVAAGGRSPAAAASSAPQRRQHRLARAPRSAAGCRSPSPASRCGRRSRRPRRGSRASAAPIAVDHRRALRRRSSPSRRRTGSTSLGEDRGDPAAQVAVPAVGAGAAPARRRRGSRRSGRGASRVNSIRRFCARPASVALSATGSSAP